MKDIRNILGWSLTVVLWLLYSFYFAGIAWLYFSWDFSTPLGAALSVTGSMVPFFLLIGLCILLITKQCRGWDSKGYFRAAMLGFLILPLAWLTMDDPPVKNDYSIHDIALSGDDVKGSYDTLMKLRKGDGLKLNIEVPWAQWTPVPTNALVFSNEIERAWEAIAEGRRVIEELDGYDRIADITRGTPMDTNTPVIGFVTLRYMAWTYIAYALLKAEQGKAEEGVHELVKFYSVVRKALPYATILVNKMIWIAVAEINIRAAQQIASSPGCPPDVIMKLAEGFKPFTEEDVSLRKSFLSEYLRAKSICSNRHMRDDYFSLLILEERPDLRVFSRMIYLFGFNPNKTIKSHKEYYDLLLAGTFQRPPSASAAEAYMEKYIAKPPFKNMAGWLLFKMGMPSFARAFNTASRTKALSDLLAMELHKKLGKTLDLPDYVTKGKYLTDKNGVSYSAGFDGIPGTRDDISLEGW